MPGVDTPSRAIDSQPAVGTAASRWWHGAWNAITEVVGAVVGLAPHVLHHIGLLAGTALVAGSGGTALFAVVGLAASAPLLLRLHRRFGNWLVPALALCVSTVLFLLSAFVVGPAISGQSDNPAPTVPSTGHLSHH
jgi:predicted PurR-regulated permease PerM